MWERRKGTHALPGCEEKCRAQTLLCTKPRAEAWDALDSLPPTCQAPGQVSKVKAKA